MRGSSQAPPTAPPGAPTSEPTATPIPPALEPTATGEASAVQPVVGVEETVDPNATPLPSPTPYTREVYQANYDSYLSNLKIFGVDEATVLAVREAQLYRERLRESFADQVQSQQEQVWARHILAVYQPLAEELLGRGRGGGSWEAPAAEFSQDR